VAIILCHHDLNRRLGRDTARRVPKAPGLSASAPRAVHDRSRTIGDALSGWRWTSTCRSSTLRIGCPIGYGRRVRQGRVRPHRMADHPRSCHSTPQIPPPVGPGGMAHPAGSLSISDSSERLSGVNSHANTIMEGAMGEWKRAGHNPWTASRPVWQRPEDERSPQIVLSRRGR
jgi:hypothetical protein